MKPSPRRRTTWLLLAAGFFLASGTKAAGPADAKKPAACTGGVEECLPQMREEVRRRGWIGLHLHGSATEVHVGGTVAGSPAARAGFRDEDQVLAINGVSLAEQPEAKLDRLLPTVAVGDEVVYRVRRGGQEIEIKLEAVEAPEEDREYWVFDLIRQRYSREELRTYAQKHAPHLWPRDVVVDD